MSNCGLDAETLKDPESKLDLVVKYLEARMLDDNVLVGRDVAGTRLGTEEDRAHGRLLGFGQFAAPSIKPS